MYLQIIREGWIYDNLNLYQKVCHDRQGNETDTSSYNNIVQCVYMHSLAHYNTYFSDDINMKLAQLTYPPDHHSSMPGCQDQEPP